jgi:hypothetical protein
MQHWPLLLLFCGLIFQPQAFAKKLKKNKSPHMSSNKNINPQCSHINKKIKELVNDISILDRKISHIHKTCIQQQTIKIKDRKLATENCQQNDDMVRQVRERGIEIQQKEDQLHGLQSDLKLYQCHQTSQQT